MEIFTKIQDAKNVRDYFLQYLVRQYKGEVSINQFKAMPEVIQIGIVYHFVTKLNIQVIVWHDVYYVSFVDPALIIEDLKSQEKLNIITHHTNGDYVITDESYTGSIFQGLKKALIETINYLDNTQWLTHHPLK